MKTTVVIRKIKTIWMPIKEEMYWKEWLIVISLAAIITVGFLGVASIFCGLLTGTLR